MRTKSIDLDFNNYLRMTTQFGVFAGALLALIFLVSIPVAAHDDNRNTGAFRDVREFAGDRGYQDGFRHGAADRSRRAGYDYRNNEYKRGDSGYVRTMGNQGQYKQAYRAGYKNGYDDAYYGRGNNWPVNGGRDRNPRNGNGNGDWGRDRDRDGRNDDWGRDRDRNDDSYGRGGNLRQLARDFGYRDGVYYAQLHMRDRRSYDPQGAKGYKDADHGYNSGYGSKDEFKRYYREAFVDGYRQEYRR
jgi:hypothetical protein